MAALQLLRHALTDGRDCGTLALAHTDDWPEVRLQLPANTSAGLSALPFACGAGGTAGPVPSDPSGATLTASDAARLLDARCHAPLTDAGGGVGGGGGGGHFFGPLGRCLAAVGRAQAGVSSAEGRDADATAAAMQEALGSPAGPAARAALRARARLLLERGLEETVVAAAGARPPPPCCAAHGCAHGAAPPIPDLGARRAARRALRHPRRWPLLEPPGLAERRATRAASSFVAPAAAHLLTAPELAALPNGSFDGRFANPCWRCAAASAEASAQSRLCCLPAAHILGVSKSGTTDLYSRLARHPSVLRSANKGPHWWDVSGAIRTFGWRGDSRRTAFFGFWRGLLSSAICSSVRSRTSRPSFPVAGPAGDARNVARCSCSTRCRHTSAVELPMFANSHTGF